LNDSIASKYTKFYAGIWILDLNSEKPNESHDTPEAVAVNKRVVWNYTARFTRISVDSPPSPLVDKAGNGKNAGILVMVSLFGVGNNSAIGNFDEKLNHQLQ